MGDGVGSRGGGVLSRGTSQRELLYGAGALLGTSSAEEERCEGESGELTVIVGPFHARILASGSILHPPEAHR